MTVEYTFYPGCSVEASAEHYLVSLEAVSHVLDVKFHEIEDWSCCGASFSYLGGNVIGEAALAARNLALAEAAGRDVVTPCSACYKNLNNTNHKLQEDPELLAKVNKALAKAGLEYKATIRVRHFLDIMANDIGLDAIKAKINNPLKGLRVAGYVGCQTVRPYCEFDSPEAPVLLDNIIKTLGAEPVNFPYKIRCCGAGMVVTQPEECYTLDKAILQSAIENGAQMITAACPMCQMNLEAYQGKINKKFGTNFNIPVLFFTQLMAVAFGMDPKKDAALGYALVPATQVLRPYM